MPLAWVAYLLEPLVGMVLEHVESEDDVEEAILWPRNAAPLLPEAEHAAQPTREHDSPPTAQFSEYTWNAAQNLNDMGGVSVWSSDILQLECADFTWRLRGKGVSCFWGFRPGEATPDMQGDVLKWHTGFLDPLSGQARGSA